MSLIFKKEAFEITGACMRVHNELGFGFLEPVYQEALQIEFADQGIPFIRECKIDIHYKGTILEKQYIADFICYNEILLETKALSELTTQHEAQVINYLKATGLQLGILVNFGQPRLQYKRIVMT